ncbi:NADPH-dependent F420 reductase [Streptomyces sp. VRA16 Mangrove soil]|uniref:NADPH-dependent F420 reductase n=1 Tax=Streptomyces sp. VRA16 Mangrove soil TaxID=2817434 RepID=UPI001A9E1BC8|nr:NAD(P)-binding domain-containing protein [Streptomyces sp. VRA16 Mangrove soil]MBO1332527.1 NAD(P)-binding domain-containing protein [Streptomyces sp. VRA16 Mangrove soil]
MRYAVLGTGIVGRTLASRLVELGHDVRMGARSKDNPAAMEWAQGAGPRASVGTFADAAEFGERVVEAVGGHVALEALRAAGAEHLDGKVVVDTSNKLEQFEGGMRLASLDDIGSVGEQLQKAFPRARVVKTLNTLTSSLMVDPAALPGAHQLFLSGDDAGAKEEVRGMLGEFGWAPERIIDLGGIETARGVEFLMPLWLNLYGNKGHAHFNWHIQTGD